MREIRDPSCSWEAASLPWLSSDEMAPEQVTVPNSLIQAVSVPASDWSLRVLAREGCLEEITLN